MLGQDKNLNEFWFFKDDPTRLYSKFAESDDQPVRWGFIDEEEAFEQLLESLNARGIREKKLQENLKKIRNQLKMKKAKKPANADKPDDEKSKEDGDVEMTEEDPRD